MGRNNPILVALCFLVAVNIFVSLRSQHVPSVHGQTAAVPTDKVAVATVQGPNLEPWVYVYDVANERLACYTTRASGIELMGVRKLTWDLGLEELPGALLGRRLSVREIQKVLKGNSESER